MLRRRSNAPAENEASVLFSGDENDRYKRGEREEGLSVGRERGKVCSLECAVEILLTLTLGQGSFKLTSFRMNNKQIQRVVVVVVFFK